MEDADAEGATPTSAPKPVYVNHCSIAAGLSDANLTFAQAGDGQQQPNVKARLVTSPTHLRRFRDVIDDACREHEAKFSEQSGPGVEEGDG